MAKEKKVQVTEEVTPVLENDNTEISILRNEVERLKVEEKEREILEDEIKLLKAQKTKINSRSGGKPLDDPTAMYRFRNLYDPKTDFSAGNSWPKTVGGKNVYTRYQCKDGGTIELPIRYAKILNEIKLKLSRWEKNADGNSVKVDNIFSRFLFERIED